MSKGSSYNTVVGTTTNNKNGRIVFDPLTYTSADIGEHLYRIEEEYNSSDTAFDYDRTYVYVKVIVSEGTGGLTVTGPIYSDKENGEEITDPDFVNKRKTGKLKVSKKVVSDFAADKNQSFDFTITLSDNTISGTYGDMEFENGVAHFSLKGGQSKTAGNIPTGITYKVTGIAPGAFKGNTKVTSITIGNYVTTIGKKAFYLCPLSKVTCKSPASLP